MTSRVMIIIAAAAGFTGVAIGAFGAHTLKDILSPEMAEIFKTGSIYHLIHSAVLLALALSGKRYFKNAFLILTAGIILFSFSLYSYAVSGNTIFAMITPLGGLCFLAGWLLIAFAAFKNSAEQ